MVNGRFQGSISGAGQAESQARSDGVFVGLTIQQLEALTHPSQATALCGNRNTNEIGHMSQ